MRTFEVTIVQRVSESDVRVHQLLVENVRSRGAAYHQIADRLVGSCRVESVVEVR